MTLIIDGHLDLAWNALAWNRDLRLSVATIRTQESTTLGLNRGLNTVCLPELRQGRVMLCFATLLARNSGTAEPHLDYLSPAQAYGAARGQLAYYRALEQTGHVRVIEDRAALDAHVALWQMWETAGAPPTAAPPLGVIVTMESADPILDPADLVNWHTAGVRLIGPAHYGAGRYAGGTRTELGLTAQGSALLAEMQRLGVILDLTHCTDQAFWQALDVYDGPVIASHNNCRAIVPQQRQFTDDQLKAVIVRDGVIGASFDAIMVRPGWNYGAATNPRVVIADVVDHIDRVCQLAGTSAHAAIGSDLDGGFGREQSPADLDSIADLQRVPALLAARGYTATDIDSIMYGNWLRLLRRCWGA